LSQYLGSTVVKELRGTESTKKSIQKLKKSSCCTKDAKATPDIVLAISYRGVKFLNTITKVFASVTLTTVTVYRLPLVVALRFVNT
jgi:hypothetical protein